MTKKIYVNLPVKDLEKSKDFFTKLGFSFDPRFTDNNAACLILGENIFSMLVKKTFFQTFTKKEVADATKMTEVLLTIDVDSIEAVDELIQKAIDAGGTQYMDTLDFDWGYMSVFEDLDGHQWEVAYTDESKIPKK